MDTIVRAPEATHFSGSSGSSTLVVLATLCSLISGCGNSLHSVPTPNSKIVELPHDESLELVWIPGGTFWMGCSPGDSLCLASAKPRHQVRVRGFWMGRYEVSQKQWEAVMGPTTWQHPGADLPAEVANWRLAQEFVARAGGGLRLPSEAEWECATRAGTETRHYGNLEEIAWYGDNSSDEHLDSHAVLRQAGSPLKFGNAMLAMGCRSHPVGQKKPNAFGLYDTLGNMLEWCEDTYSRTAYASREGSVTDDPIVNAAGDSVHVIRGGCYLDPDHVVTVSARAFSAFVLRLPPSTLGLRVARTEPDSR